MGPGSPVAPISPASSGGPVSGMPFSGPPGVPMSPASGPVGAGGTRVMPGAGGAGPVSGAPGNPNAGRAGVPPPPSRTDTMYTYGAADLGASPPPPVRPPARQPGGAAGGGRAKGRNNLALIAVALGVLVVLVFGGIGAYVLTRGDGDKPDAGTPTASAATGGPTQANTTANVACSRLRGKQLKDVRAELEGLGFTVKTRTVVGAIPNEVREISPCGEQPQGATITLSIVGSLRNNTPGFPSGRPSFPNNKPSEPSGNGGPSASPSCSGSVPGTDICVD
jgi:hypothetical protein